MSLGKASLKRLLQAVDHAGLHRGLASPSKYPHRLEWLVRGEGSKAKRSPTKLCNRLLCPNRFETGCVQVKHSCVGKALGKRGSNAAGGSGAGTSYGGQPGSVFPNQKMHAAFDPATPLPDTFPTDSALQLPSGVPARIFV